MGEEIIPKLLWLKNRWLFIWSPEWHPLIWIYYPLSSSTKCLRRLKIKFYRQQCFSSLNLLGWHWLTELYRFQMPNSITPRLYTVLCVHHPKSSSITYIPPISSFTSPNLLFTPCNHHTVVCIQEFVFFWLMPSSPPLLSPAIYSLSLFWLIHFLY